MAFVQECVRNCWKKGKLLRRGEFGNAYLYTTDCLLNNNKMAVKQVKTENKQEYKKINFSTSKSN